LAVVSSFLGLVFVAQPPISSGWFRITLWAFLIAVLPHLWFLAYALHDVNARREHAPSSQRLGVFHPFWGSSLTPIGKGLSYLRKFEAQTAQELAVTQLKGLKLAIWACLLAACKSGLASAVYGYMEIPQFDDAFSQFTAGAAPSPLLCWASLVSSFVLDLLDLTVAGGMIIAFARLAGFRLLRNTYRPLHSKTLAEFWNRYYFYYKELLVDHFFYPTFLLCFRKHRRLRVFFATFAAACVGNLLFHFLRDIRFVVKMGFWRAAVGDQSDAFYTLLLAVGVGCSQMLQRNRTEPPGWLRGNVLPCLWVIAFFCILHVFDAPLDREHTLWQRAQFLFYMAGVGKWI
jgi:hypothetical protein